MPNEKDSTEKHLLNYADVFADVVNVLVFHGKEVIDPKDLVSTEARSVLTLHGKTREQERDVVKIWTKGNTKIALVGLENQTLPNEGRESPRFQSWDERPHLRVTLGEISKQLFFCIYSCVCNNMASKI